MNKEGFGNVVGILLGIALFVGIALLLIPYLLWQLWMYVIPAMFTTAPESVKHPSFWIFFGFVILLNWLRGSASKGSS